LKIGIVQKPEIFLLLPFTTYINSANFDRDKMQANLTEAAGFKYLYRKFRVKKVCFICATPFHNSATK